MDEKINMHFLLIWCVLCFTLFNGGVGQVENEIADDVSVLNTIADMF